MGVPLSLLRSATQLGVGPRSRSHVRRKAMFHRDYASVVHAARPRTWREFPLLLGHDLGVLVSFVAGTGTARQLGFIPRCVWSPQQDASPLSAWRARVAGVFAGSGFREPNAARELECPAGTGLAVAAGASSRPPPLSRATAGCAADLDCIAKHPELVQEFVISRNWLARFAIQAELNGQIAHLTQRRWNRLLVAGNSQSPERDRQSADSRTVP
jgi:hypothetical protein